MVGSVGDDDVVALVQVVDAEVLAHLGLALAVRVDVLPCRGVGVGELVGRDADDVAVDLVELHEVVRLLAVDERPEEWAARYGAEFWAGVAGEGVEVDVVDCVSNEIENALG